MLSLEGVTLQGSLSLPRAAGISNDMREDLWLPAPEVDPPLVAVASGGDGLEMVARLRRRGSHPKAACLAEEG